MTPEQKPANIERVMAPDVVEAVFIRVHTHRGQRYRVGDKGHFTRREIDKLIALDVIKPPDTDG